jgi:hypothetical protein
MLAQNANPNLLDILKTDFINECTELLLTSVTDSVNEFTEEDILEPFPSAESIRRAIEKCELELQMNLSHPIPDDIATEYTTLEAVRAQLHSSVPLRKMQYPEPFIASASFIHTDIGFIHVLQYQYWLWFLFI